MSWVSGDAVDAMKLMREKDIIAKCMRVLRSMFSDVPDPTAHIVTRWSQDPMAGMCYSYVKVTGEGSTNVSHLLPPSLLIYRQKHAQ